MTEYLDIGSDHQFLVPTSPWMPSAISSSVGGSVVVDNSWTLDDSAIPSLRFPQKLWRIVNECNSGAITWGLSGQTVRLNYKSFQNEYLSAGASIFKTSNIASFIRQLNLYGFRKLATNTRDPFGPIPTAQEQDIHEFVHEHFREGRLDLLSRVCRKTGVKKTGLATTTVSKCAIKRKVTQPAKGGAAEEKSVVSVDPGVDAVTTSLVKKEKDELETVHYVEKRSRLQMCRAALTEALEEATLLYKREKLWLQLVNANILSESFLPKYETLTVDQNVEVVFQDDLSVLGDNCQIVEDSSSNSIVDNDEKNQWQEVLSLENGGTISISTPFL